jgi:hypothetical protein
MNLPVDPIYTLATVKHKPLFDCPVCKQDGFAIEYFFANAEKKDTYTDTKFCKHCSACVELNTDGVLLGYRIITDVLEYPIYQPHYVHAISDHNENPIQVVIKVDLTVGTDDDGDEHGRYWVNEHTCPTNWLRVDVIAQHGDLDPHGVFRFVKKIPIHEANRIIAESPLLSDEDRRGWGRKCNDENAWELLFPGLRINKQVLNEDGDPLTDDDYIDGMSDVVAEVEALPEPKKPTNTTWPLFIPFRK